MESAGLIIVLLVGLVWVVGMGCTIYSFFERPIPNFTINKKLIKKSNSYKNLENLGFINDSDEENASVIIID